METVNYRELARRVGDCILHNTIHNTTSNDFGDWELWNGDDSYCYKHEDKAECEKDEFNTCQYESYDIYQEYIISENGADYLKRKTNEIVYYNERLDMYLWGITHFGTAWDGVYTTIKE